MAFWINTTATLVGNKSDLVEGGRLDEVNAGEYYVYIHTGYQFYVVHVARRIEHECHFNILMTPVVLRRRT